MTAPSTKRRRRRLDILRDRAGVAAVEFALILPLMLLMFLGSVEITRALMASRRAALTARTLADLISQQADGTPVTDMILDQTFAAATAIMAPFSSVPLKMTITSVEFVADPKAPMGYDAKPRWTAVRDGGAPRPCNILAPVANGAQPGSGTLPQGVYGEGAIVVADVAYTYTPTFGGRFFDGQRLAETLIYRHSAYMRPRQWTGPTNYIGFGGASATVCPSY